MDSLDSKTSSSAARKIEAKFLLMVIGLAMTAFSCSFSFFKTENVKNNEANRPAQLSGFIHFNSSCPQGYYHVRLQGIQESSQVQVMTEADAAGKFTMNAPMGKYLLWVHKGECGAKESVELQENTEHMISISVDENNSIEKYEEMNGRFPASIVEPLPTDEKN